MSNLSDWTSVKFGDLVEGCRGVSYQPSDLLEENTPHSLVLLRANNIQNGRLNFNDIQIVPEKIVKPVQRLNIGDIAVCMSNGSKRLVGKSAQLTVRNGFDCTIGAFCSVFRPKQESEKSFVNQLFGSNVYQAHIDISLAGSAINNLKNSDIESIPIVVPPKPKQRKIGYILETFDQNIEKTEALIEKYQQIKAGLMHDLFTRGITADGKLRPPIEQAPELYHETPIGWIPKDWNIIALGEISDIASGVTLNSKTSPDRAITVPYLRVANVQDGYLDLKEVKEVLVNQSMFLNLLLQPGDVLMNEGGDFDKLGRGTVWEGEIEPCIHQNHVFRVRTNKEILHPYYLAFWSESSYGKKYFILSSKQSTNLASINSTQLKTYPIALPSLEEQQRIKNRINTVNTKINSLRKEAKKLGYQKLGLMHDLLTGAVPVTIDDGDTND